MNQRMRAGKSSELIVAGELTGRGLDVYFPCVDGQGVDLVVRVANAQEVHHFDIEVKTVSDHSRIIGVRLPKVRQAHWILLLHYRYDGRSDEFYYLTADQADPLLVRGSKFNELNFSQLDRAKYQSQDLAALASYIRSYSSRPGTREVRVQALRYVASCLGDALRVGNPDWRAQTHEWIVTVHLNEGDIPVGEICLDEWGQVIPNRSATFDSVRGSANASRSTLPAA